MLPAEWDALPWWVQRLYIEGLQEEFGSDPDGSTAAGGYTTQRGVTALDGNPGEFAALGIKERSL